MHKLLACLLVLAFCLLLGRSSSGFELGSPQQSKLAYACTTRHSAANIAHMWVFGTEEGVRTIASIQKKAGGLCHQVRSFLPEFNYGNKPRRKGRGRVSIVWAEILDPSYKGSEAYVIFVGQYEPGREA